MENLASNPFASLFPSIEDAQNFASQKPEDFEQGKSASGNNQSLPKEEKFMSDLEDRIYTNQIIERIFLITLNQNPTDEKSRPFSCVYLQELSESLQGQDWLDLDCLHNAVFERALLRDPNGFNCKTSTAKNAVRHSHAEVTENLALKYLYQCFLRTKEEARSVKDLYVSYITVCQEVIVQHAKTCLQMPDVLPEQQPWKQYLDIFLDECNNHDCESMVDFLQRVAIEITSNREEGDVFHCLQDALKKAKDSLQNDFDISHPGVFPYVEFVTFFTTKECLAEALLKFTTPKESYYGKAYENTLLGSILSLSCVPKKMGGETEFFNNPSRFTQQEHDATSASLWRTTVLLNDKVHRIILNLLKLSDPLKHQMLNWLGNCMHSNAGRSKMWMNILHDQHSQMMSQMYCSDGFFINLCAVLLRLCRPFSEPCSPKLLKIQPSYCVVEVKNEEEVQKRNVHMKGLSKETCLIPTPEGAVQETEPSYNFLTECFFLTHHCLHLGVHVIQEKFTKLNQELHRVQTLYQDLVNGGGTNSEMGQRLQAQMQKWMSSFLCIKTALLEPQLVELNMNLHTATATLLTHFATSKDSIQFSPVTFPLHADVPMKLTTIPEFVIEDLVDFLVFIRRFNDDRFEVIGDKVNHIMTLILVFMGSPDRMKNPHLRAKLAETLEMLMPVQDKPGMRMGLVANYHREQLFKTHPLIEHLSPVLLHVFVSIEMTGQAVEFEQKFNYRRPMYKVLEYIWELDLHKNAIKKLAQESEGDMEATDPPLFLRFINYLISDGIFLLDEALSHMVQIKDMQEAKDAGEWQNLPQQQHQENEQNLRQLTNLAKFFNIMSKETIHTLEYLTQEIQSIFTHDVMVHRIAAMLNYFLLHLVGPKKKNLKVKNFDEVHFKPQLIVSDICQIYLNLGSNSAFCVAVCSDGRSYSADLFHQAEKVLHRINRPEAMIAEFAGLAEEIHMTATRQKEEEDNLAEAPEEFLDPILGTIMKDPVKLPSSGMIVDRGTIARHILSDQTDPFNRSPLTMDMIHTDQELKSRIEEWIAKNTSHHD